MDYEKKYKDALERAKDVHTYYCDDREQLRKIESIFPELVESEDEKIRRWIIDDIRYNMNNEPLNNSEYKKKAEKAIAWLEKQGKHKDYYTKQELIDMGFSFTLNGDIVTPDKMMEDMKKYLAWHGRQDEQKPILDFNVVDWQPSKVDGKIHNIYNSGVEPKFHKFHEGDWFVNNNTKDVFLIKSFNNGFCTLEDIKGNIISPCLPPCESESHIWTIADAKAGDALYLQKDGKEHIILYKGIIKEKFRTFVSAYCAYNGIVDDFCFADVSRYADIAYGDIIPATKEQRNLLFQKMKEAGYTFDFGKKELKEIEEEYDGEDYGIDSLWHAQRILEETLGKVEGYQTDDGILSHKCAISAVKKLYKKKPVEWHREDEQNLNATLSYIDDEYLRRWLKDAIYNKYEKPTEWSEEDENILNNLIDYFEVNDVLQHSEKQVVYWLKTLKERIGE